MSLGRLSGNPETRLARCTVPEGTETTCALSVNRWPRPTTLPSSTSPAPRSAAARISAAWPRGERSPPPARRQVRSAVPMCTARGPPSPVNSPAMSSATPSPNRESVVVTWNGNTAMRPGSGAPRESGAQGGGEPSGHCAAAKRAKQASRTSGGTTRIRRLCYEVPRRRAMEWQVMIDATGHAGASNMALDALLLEDAARTGRATLRLYRWAPSCLSFGRNEPALARYDRAEIERRGISVVHRPTGGRAVWHDRELTYAVAAPIAAFGTLAEAYRIIHERIAMALGTLGVVARVAPVARPEAIGAGACFASAVGGEVVAG